MTTTTSLANKKSNSTGGQILKFLAIMGFVGIIFVGLLAALWLSRQLLAQPWLINTSIPVCNGFGASLVVCDASCRFDILFPVVVIDGVGNGDLDQVFSPNHRW